MKYPRVWENINEDKDAGSARLKIHGGWLVVSWTMYGNVPCENLIFVSDQSHSWELEAKY